MASCSEEREPTCVPNQTRLCAGVGRCQGFQTCLADSSGYGPCDCSGPPREGGGGTSGDSGEITPLVGRSCSASAECGAGLTCFTPDSNDFLGGGPAGGYCSIGCTEDSQCTSIDPQSQCVAGPAGGGVCIRNCLSQDPTSLAENKCLGRRDLVCQSEVYLGLADFSGLRQLGWCYPQCASDEDCGGRVCDLARGLCVDTPTTGLALGEPCTSNDECAGRICVGVAPGEAFCSAPCVFGVPIGCGYGIAPSTPRGAACFAPQVQGFLSSEGEGDIGFCAQMCSDVSECTQANRGWECRISQDLQARLNRPGVCLPPQQTVADAGAVDGGGDAAASDSDASVQSP